jgi:hypothetical protein
MSRIAALLALAALLSTGPGLALGAGEQGKNGRIRASQSEEVEACAAASEASRCETRKAEGIPIFIPRNRGSLPTRIGGASRGGSRPARQL